MLLVLFGFVGLSNADTFDVMVGASSNTNVSSVSVGQLGNSTMTCTGFKVWEDSLTYDLVLYLGDPTSSTTMYYTIPGGTTATIEYMVPSQKDEGIYIKATTTADATVNYVGYLKKGYKK